MAWPPIMIQAREPSSEKPRPLADEDARRCQARACQAGRASINIKDVSGMSLTEVPSTITEEREEEL